MLFKTISASVYGIDAYLVEVEVDVGSARMQDFNVVGLPDNAVKESRERIKSALRNCGFEFPYGQGVTINLAPADVRKEGSGFDLPMALGLAGCMGQFFGKPLDQCMFLGELSLDGGVRPVRGALSAALAARDKGLKAIAVSSGLPVNGLQKRKQLGFPSCFMLAYGELECGATKNGLSGVTTCSLTYSYRSARTDQTGRCPHGPISWIIKISVPLASTRALSWMLAGSRSSGIVWTSPA
jgi:hypothetical protein